LLSYRRSFGDHLRHEHQRQTQVAGRLTHTTTHT
jgi:hypothetical protein